MTTQLNCSAYEKLIEEDVVPKRVLYKLCRHCGQPMRPKGVKKKHNEYDHAQGCPYNRTDLMGNVRKR